MKKNSYIILGVVAVIIIAVIVIRARPMVPTNSDPQNTNAVSDASVKEFAIQSFVEFVDGKPMPQFSPTAIALKKGDRVRLKVTVTKGIHDFHIDEFNIHVQTPLDVEQVIEFVADKTGEFVYYCNKTGHRQAGHWGTLSITE